ncbi:MAG: LptF/LptG family permease [Planctomycetes bacterium]|nr:LptF/LptG family permease [Planctomycetota bacterium]
MQRTREVIVSRLPARVPEREAPGARRSTRRRRRWRVLRLPWTLYGYVGGEVFRVFLLAVFAVSLLYTTLAAYQAVRAGLQLSLVAPLLAKSFAYPLYFSIPLALIFAVTLVLGRMVNELEVDALYTHGISHAHVYAPVLLLGLSLAVASFYLNGWVVPEIHYQKRNLQTYILTQLENLGTGVNRTIPLLDEEGTLWVGAYKGTQLRNVRFDLVTRRESSIVPAIREHLPERLPGKVTIFAGDGRIEIQPGRQAVVLHLRSVEVHVPEPVRGARISNEVFHQVFSVTEDVLIPLSFLPKSPGTKDRKHPELLRHIDDLLAERKALDRGDVPVASEGETAAIEYAAFKGSPEEMQERRRALDRKLASAITEFHRRQAFTLSCLTFPLLGVALSLVMNRSSRLVPFLLANLAVIGIYYPLLMVGVALGDGGFAPGLSLLFPNAALLGLGIQLTRKAVRR